MAQSDLEVSNAALIKLGEATIAALADTTKRATLVNARVDICKRTLLRRHPWNFATKRAILEPTLVNITGAQTSGGLIKILTASTSGLTSGDRVTIKDVLGTSEANGTWVTQNVVANTSFELVASTFTHTWTSGGTWTLASKFDFTYSIALPSDCLRVLRINDVWVDPNWNVEIGRVQTNDSTLYLKYIKDVTDYATMPVDFYEALALYLAVDIALAITASDERKSELKKELREALALARFADATEDPAESLEANEWLASRTSSVGFAFDRSR